MKKTEKLKKKIHAGLDYANTHKAEIALGTGCVVFTALSAFLGLRSRGRGEKIQELQEKCSALEKSNTLLAGENLALVRDNKNLSLRLNNAFYQVGKEKMTKYGRK